MDKEEKRRIVEAAIEKVALFGGKPKTPKPGGALKSFGRIASKALWPVGIAADIAFRAPAARARTAQLKQRAMGVINK